MRHRFRRRAWKRLFWGLTILLVVLVGGLWLAYSYATDSATLAAAIRREAPKYLPTSRVTVDRARLRPFVGEVSLANLTLWNESGGRDVPVLRAPWIHIRHDFAEIWHGRYVPREVIVAQPKLRLWRRKDGSWNLQGLLADPWPGPPRANTPTILIQSGTVELVEAGGVPMALLRDVTVRVDGGAADAPLHFQGSAKGEDLFDRLELEGTIDPKTGKVSLTKGDLTRLSLSSTLRRRLPEEFRPQFDAVGLTGGEADLTLNRLEFDPSAAVKLRYDAGARLRSGTWACKKLPFPLNDVSAAVTARDGAIVIERAEGSNGKTTVRAEGKVSLDDAAATPGSIDLTVNVFDLELDARLKARTPPEYAGLWDDFKPSGRVSLALRVMRPRAGAPLGFGLGVDCRDVAMEYRHFKYPVDHVSGSLKWQGRRIDLNLRTTVGNRPADCIGTIDDPGPDAVVRLEFHAESFPIDETLRRAMPRDVRKVVDQFQPTGSVRVEKAVVVRLPPGPADPPEGKVTIDADLALTEEGRCAITWEGMPYPVTKVTGRLEIHPDRWIVKDMRGVNNLATVRGSGQVDQISPGKLKVGLHLTAEHLPFDEQLRLALPGDWKGPWAILNPHGSTRVDAKIAVEPGKPDHYHVEIRPEAETRINLVLDAGAGRLAFPAMEKVAGRFVYDDGTVTMSDVGFDFHGSPVDFRTGEVHVHDGGRFDMRVRDLHVTDFRIDAALRQLMPPVMAQFAHRLDEAHTFTMRADLGLGWDGPGHPAWCEWSKGLAVFSGNSIQAGLPLEHIRGQIEGVRGKFDGEALEVHGLLNLESVALMGQQITRLKSPLDVVGGKARLGPISGNLLDGKLAGTIAVGLDATPTYSSDLTLDAADLQSLARTLPGRQTFKGLVTGRLALSGIGYDVRTLQGNGEAHITQGDLGELPAALRLFKLLNLSRATKTAFDSADVAMHIRDGRTTLAPIQLTGDAFSLRGAGTLDTQGELNLRLRLLYGRDSWHVRGLSDALREASGNIFDIHVTGPVASPQPKLEALPLATDAFRRSMSTVLHPGRRRDPDRR